MNEWNTNENPLLRGARSAQVGTPVGITDASNAKFGSEGRREFVLVDLRLRREVGALAVGDVMVLPRDQLAAGVDAGLEVVQAAGPVVVVAHVVFAGPEQLDRDARTFWRSARLRASSRSSAAGRNRRPRAPGAR